MVSQNNVSQENMQTQIGEESGWETIIRDDLFVAEELHATKAMDRIYQLGTSAFLDGFFHYMDEIGILPLLADLDPKDRTRPLYPFIHFVLLTIMRCGGDVERMLATHDVLLTDKALMGLFGFNAVHLQQDSDDQDLSPRTEPLKICGTLSYETIADTIVNVGAEKLSAMFNGAIRCLAKQSLFPKDIDAVLDAMDDEATSNYQTDAGSEVPSVTRTDQHTHMRTVTVFGWKIWIVFEPVSNIPLALKIDGINVPDNEHAYEVLSQACANVKNYACIRSVTLDRRFLDDHLLSQIDESGIIIYIPAQSNMTISTDALEIARRAQALAAEGKKLPGSTYKERIKKVYLNSGKQFCIEERKTIVVRIKKLPCNWWTPQCSTSAANSKHFEPKQINATVVLQWDGAPKDAEQEFVILDTNPRAGVFVGVNAYNNRSLIENQCNRKAKENWFLEHHPKHSEAGMRVQAYFVFTCMALINAFQRHQQAAQAELRAGMTGISYKPRFIKTTSYNKVIVIRNKRFGIFRDWEAMLLAGISIRTHMLMGESSQSVLERYQAQKPSPS